MPWDTKGALFSLRTGHKRLRSNHRKVPALSNKESLYRIHSDHHDISEIKFFKFINDTLILTQLLKGLDVSFAVVSLMACPDTR